MEAGKGAEAAKTNQGSSRGFGQGTQPASLAWLGIDACFSCFVQPMGHFIKEASKRPSQSFCSIFFWAPRDTEVSLQSPNMGKVLH